MATRTIRSGEATAAVYIPPSFEHDLLAGRRAQIVAFYNTQYSRRETSRQRG
jgi:ABC-2 type transport system permease protein